MLAAASAVATDVAPDATALLARIARPPPASIRYTEVRYSSLLTRPLVVTGQLAYQGPGRFDRMVEQPYRETTTIRGQDVVVARDGQASAHFSLQRAPALGGMLETFGALLSGDRKMLDRSFRVTVSGTVSAWHIALEPRASTLGKWLSRIDIDGSDETPRCITLLEPDGDRGVMLLGTLADEPLPAPLDPPALQARCAAPAGS